MVLTNHICEGGGLGYIYMLNENLRYPLVGKGVGVGDLCFEGTAMS